VPFTVRRPALPPLLVDAEEHRIEGAWHVFRRTTAVMGAPRTVVVLRLAAATVTDVEPPAGAVP
jgi:hypothetical protein